MCAMPILQITGGSSGIGKAVAVEALKRGAAFVTLVARNEVAKGTMFILIAK